MMKKKGFIRAIFHAVIWHLFGFLIFNSISAYQNFQLRANEWKCHQFENLKTKMVGEQRIRLNEFYLWLELWLRFQWRSCKTVWVVWQTSFLSFFLRWFVALYLYHQCNEWNEKNLSCWFNAFFAQYLCDIIDYSQRKKLLKRK